MSRLIFCPQFPTHLRYSEWWYYIFPIKLKPYFNEIVVLGKDFIHQNNSLKINYDKKLFSPVNDSISFEYQQVQDYLDLELTDDDILLLADISFPGIFANILYHKRCLRMFSYCHATAYQKYDYYLQNRKSKFKVESGQSQLFNSIFVGSNYHKEMLKWKNIEVVALPSPPFVIHQEVEKTNNIISVCRPDIQKINKVLENRVSREISKVIRKPINTWNEYSTFLSSSNVLLITSKADTFNYTILDAIKCKCTPIAPRRLCFPEILDDQYLYSDGDEAIEKINNVLNGDIKIPTKVKCQSLVDNFYENIAKRMLD